MVNAKKKRKPCALCGKEPRRAYYTYCSNSCQREYEYRLYIQRWKAGDERGLQCIGTVSRHIKKYLREKYNNRCCLCGWSKVNPKSGVVHLVADHVDGNWKNNTEENVRLLCPNCDSLTPTFAGLNRGNGRKNRAVSKRIIEGRSLMNE